LKAVLRVTQKQLDRKTMTPRAPSSVAETRRDERKTVRFGERNKGEAGIAQGQ
jgi:hypothetical protein